MSQVATDALLKRRTVIPGLTDGQPAIRGLRFPVGNIPEMLGSGLNTGSVLEQHPVLEKEDIQAALLYVPLKFKNTVMIHAA